MLSSVWSAVTRRCRRSRFRSVFARMTRVRACALEENAPQWAQRYRCSCEDPPVLSSFLAPQGNPPDRPWSAFPCDDMPEYRRDPAVQSIPRSGDFAHGRRADAYAAPPAVAPARQARRAPDRPARGAGSTVEPPTVGSSGAEPGPELDGAGAVVLPEPEPDEPGGVVPDCGAGAGAGVDVLGVVAGAPEPPLEGAGACDVSSGGLRRTVRPAAAARARRPASAATAGAVRSRPRPRGASSSCRPPPDAPSEASSE